MTQITITCPHCSFSKVLDSQQIPAGAKNITCPQCKQSFQLSENAQPAAASAAQQTTPGIDPSGQFKYCSTCGQQIHTKAEICPSCGVRVAPAPGAINKVALLLITFFLGGFGGHKFYQKKYLQGVLYLLFFWTYIPGLAALIEFIIYACKSEAELQQRYPETSSGAVVLAVVLPFIGIAIIGILAAIAIPQFAAYRQKAYSAAATSDLRACQTRAEAYYAEHQAYPTRIGDMQCRASKGVALYYLSLGPEKFQLVSYHNQGQKAYLQTSNEKSIKENDREKIKGQLLDKFGPSVVGPEFHFIE